MADINLNAATYEQIVTVLSRLATNYSNLAGTFYDVFYNPNPQDVSFQMYNDAGVLEEFTVENLAKSNTYRLSGPQAPVDSAPTGTIYQDLSTGDVYAYVNNIGWTKLVNKDFFDNYILQGTGVPQTPAKVGTLYVDTDSAALYISISSTGGWASISAPVLDYADKDLSNLTPQGRGKIAEVVEVELGKKTTVIDSTTDSNALIPTARAVYEKVTGLQESKQSVANMDTATISESSTRYPSSGLVKSYIDNILGNLSDEINAL